MGRKLHEQAVIIVAKGATDVGGSGVYEYIIYALRAAKKEDGAPTNIENNFKNKVEIGRISNLSNIVSWRGGASPEIRPYDPLNEYRFYWYGWESGYNYRFWMLAADQAGNIEEYTDGDPTYNTAATEDQVVDTVAPQFVVLDSKNDPVPYTSHNKISLKTKWAFSRTGDRFTVQPSFDGNYPGWVEDVFVGTIPKLMVVTDSMFNPTYYWWFAITNNEIVGLADVVDVEDYGIKLIVATGELSKVAVSDAPAGGSFVIVPKIQMTAYVGSMTLNFEGADPDVADIDHYEVQRYVANTSEPDADDFAYNLLVKSEETTLTDYNLIWKRDVVKNGENETDPENANRYISPRGLYLITPIDIYGNRGVPSITWSYVNVDGYQPRRGIAPSTLVADDVQTKSDNDGNITLLFNLPSDDDLKGIQIQRRRGAYNSGDKYLSASYTWDSWETIAQQVIDSYVAGIDGFEKKYVDPNLEPYTPADIGYQYQICGFDYSGNTSLAWTLMDDSEGHEVILAVDTSVNTVGAGLTCAGKIGSISIVIAQPTDYLSVKAYLWRSIGDNVSYEADAFKIVELPETGNCYTQDEYPPVDEEVTIYYKVQFEDKWGNKSVMGFETSATSKTARTAGDSTPPYHPSDIDVHWRPEMPGTVSGTSGESFVTYTPDGVETPDDYLSAGDFIEITGTLELDGNEAEIDFNDPDIDYDFGGNLFNKYQVDHIDGNTIYIVETITFNFSGQKIIYDLSGVVLVTFTRPFDQILPGTIGVVNDSPVVTGTGTEFSNYFVNGELIRLKLDEGDIDKEILSVDSDLQITLSVNVQQATQSGKEYRGSIDYAGAVLFKRRVYEAQMSGLLVIGQEYLVDEYIAGDDFTNVGGVNVSGSRFVAAGTTPTDWSHASTLRQLGDTVIVASIPSKSVTTVEDRNAVVGNWMYGMTSYDSFNNETETIGWQTLVNGESGWFITVADTTAPLSAEALIMTGGLGRMTFTWSRPGDDIDHYKIIIKNEIDEVIKIEDNIYSESYTLYNRTELRTAIAKHKDKEGVEQLDHYWKFQIITYDTALNYSQSTWAILDERTGGSGFIEQNAFLDRYEPASGSPASNATELLDAISSITSGKNADIILTFDFLQIITGASQIERLILERYRESDDAKTRVVELLAINNSFANVPAYYRDTELLTESGTGSAKTERFKYRLVAVTYGGMITESEDAWTSLVYCTDTTGIDIGPEGLLDISLAVSQNVGSIHLEWEDKINRDNAGYEIYRSFEHPNSWTELGVDYEKIAQYMSNRSAVNEKMVYDDNDWDNLTGTILRNKTILGDHAYDGKIAYYMLVGVDRFGNRYAISEVTKHAVSVAVSCQWYQPSLPLPESGYMMFPYDVGLCSSRGHYPLNTTSPMVTLTNEGKFGKALRANTVPDNIMEYATNHIQDGDMELGDTSYWETGFSSGYGYYFDGVNDKITVAHSTVYELGTSDFTFVTDFIAHSLAFDNRLAYKYQDNDNRWRFVPINNGSINFGVTVGGVGYGSYTSSSGIITANKINSIAFVSDRDGIKGKFYSNGVAVTTTEEIAMNSGSLSNAGDLFFGTNGAGQYSNLTVLRSLFFNLALSQAEILQIQQSGIVPYKYIGASQTAVSNEAMTADYGIFDSQVRSARSNASVGGENSTVITIDGTATSTHYICDSNASGILDTGKAYKITADIYVPSGNSLVDGVGFGISVDRSSPTTVLADVQITTPTADTWVTSEVVLTNDTYDYDADDRDVMIVLADGNTVSISGNSTDYIGIKNVSITQIGCVAEYDYRGVTNDYWYDFSGNNHHATNHGATVLTDQSAYLYKSQDEFYNGSTSLALLPGAHASNQMTVSPDQDYVVDFRYKAESGDKLTVMAKSAYGIELSTDGGFDNWEDRYHPTDWTVVGNVKQYSGIPFPGLSTYMDSPGGVWQDFTTITGNLYKVKFDRFTYNLDSYFKAHVYNGSGIGGDQIATGASAPSKVEVWEEDEFYFVAQSTTTTIYILRYGTYMALADNVSIMEVVPAMYESFITVEGTGEWAHSYLTFHTGSGVGSINIDVIPDNANSNPAYFDYTFVSKSLVAYGDMEYDDFWNNNYGTPTINALSDTQVYDGYASRKFVTNAANEGFQSDNFTTVENQTYYVTMMVYSSTSSIKVKIRKGDNSGDNVSTSYSVTASTWSQVKLLYTESDGGDLAYIAVYSESSGATVYVDSIFVANELSGISVTDIVPKYDAVYVEENGIPKRGISTSKFTIDMFVRHSWDANDSIGHDIFDTTGETTQQNRLRIVKDASNNLSFYIYGDTVGGYKQKYLAVTESNFVKNVWHRLTTTFDASDDVLAMYLNGYPVESEASGGSWVDPTTWGSHFFIGGKNDGTPGDIDIDQVTIFNFDHPAEDICTWYFANTPFVDDGPKFMIVCPEVSDSWVDHMISRPAKPGYTIVIDPKDVYEYI
ncbi:MAG: hypothetical protein WCY30_00480 [Candidatus Neomarinimicrobiota bacterium]|jgi:hypothetical protein